MTGRRPYRDPDRTPDVSECLPVTVRKAGQTDLLPVVRIERACFSEPWTIDAFERLLSEPAFLVAEGPSGVVGYVVADVTPNLGRDIGHVKDLAVTPDHRGRGIGRRLLRAAVARLAAQGAVVVKLEVRESNEPARGLYRSEGFSALRRVPRYYSDGEDALVMLLDLVEWDGTDRDVQ